jgi:hypothetical protein
VLLDLIADQIAVAIVVVADVPGAVVVVAEVAVVAEAVRAAVAVDVPAVVVAAEVSSEREF